MKPHENPEFLALYREGKTSKQIATALKAGPGTIRKWVGFALADGLIQTRVKKWTPEEEASLKSQYETGVHLTKISEALGRPIVAIEGKAAVMGLRRLVGKSAANQMKWTDHLVSELKRLVGEHKSDAEIAKKLGATRRAIQNKRFTLNLAPGGVASPKWTPEKEKRLRYLWPFHGTSEIARMMGITMLQAHTKSLRMGLPRKGYPNTRKTADRDYKTVAEASRKRAGIKLGPRPAKAAFYPAPEVIPETARPWVTRRFGECAYPHGERGNIHSCCKPVIGQSQWCSDHFALCISYERKAA